MNADRVLADLRELARPTGGPDGARRVCWTDEWTKARELLRARLEELPVTVDIDEAGNLWAELPGDGDGFVIVGSHLDSVPNGGWLDGALGMLAALEALRTLAEAGRPPVAAARRLGRRGGRPLRAQPVRLLGLRRARSSPTTCATCATATASGSRTSWAARRRARPRASRRRLDGAHAYLELHIEQGPVLESRGEPAATVLGTCGGRAPRGVSSPARPRTPARRPMALRRDSFAATAQAALAIREIGFRHDGVCTVGGATSEPGVVTAIAGRTEMLLDQRHSIPTSSPPCSPRRAACEQAAGDHGCTVELRHVWSIPPIPFDDRLIALARRSVAEAAGRTRRSPSARCTTRPRWRGSSRR